MYQTSASMLKYSLTFPFKQLIDKKIPAYSRDSGRGDDIQLVAT
ncbi:hypothetical protein LPE509_02260 [Legionella pneumophila subsp. pneumophila LPE509]|nr:hypothetical protein LPE509_02260 [Legionella pneumophila subsp. pneumophila LPE509]